VVSLGWGWDEVEEEITMRRLRTLNRYFEAHPPLHLLAAAFAGMKRGRSATPNNRGAGTQGSPAVASLLEGLIDEKWAGRRAGVTRNA
jgi:hypothetical protein